MVDVMIWDPIERGLWAIVIFLYFLTTIIYINKAREYKDHQEKEIIYGFAVIYITVGLNRMFFYLSDIFVKGSFQNGIFYGNFGETTFLLVLFAKFGYITLIIGFTVLLFSLKTIFNRSKYPIFVINTIIAILIIVLPYALARIFTIYAIFANFAIIFFLIFYVTLRSSMEFKAISSIILGGYLISLSGTILYMDDVKMLNVIPLAFPPILNIAGAFIMLTPFFLNPQYFNKAKLYWVIIGVSTTILSLSIWFFLLFSNIPLPMTIGFLMIVIFTIVTFYRSLQLIKAQEITDNSDDNINILSMFTQSKNVTEEEISISKEKRICLVCKGKLKGAMFICGDCGTYYCDKCSDVLMTLENICWVCELPLDPTKEMKIDKGKLDEIKIKEEKQYKSLGKKAYK